VNIQIGTDPNTDSKMLGPCCWLTFLLPGRYRSFSGHLNRTVTIKTQQHKIKRNQTHIKMSYT